MTIYYTYIECASNFIKDLDVYRCLKYGELIKTGLISIILCLQKNYTISLLFKVLSFDNVLSGLEDND